MSETPRIDHSDIYEAPLLVEVGGFAERTEGGPQEIPEGGRAEMAR
ncbi:lasso RiPP family leader peptide-containing protein [Streptomyces olivoreticuli]